MNFTEGLAFLSEWIEFRKKTTKRNIWSYWHRKSNGLMHLKIASKTYHPSPHYQSQASTIPRTSLPNYAWSWRPSLWIRLCSCLWLASSEESILCLKQESFSNSSILFLLYLQEKWDISECLLSWVPSGWWSPGRARDRPHSRPGNSHTRPCTVGVADGCREESLWKWNLEDVAGWSITWEKKYKSFSLNFWKFTNLSFYQHCFFSKPSEHLSQAQIIYVR